MLYTIEVHKEDKRCSAGERQIKRIEKEFKTRKEVDELAAKLMADPKIRVAINETMVERINIMTKQPFMERFDTPRVCSPASEIYWSK